MSPLRDAVLVIDRDLARRAALCEALEAEGFAPAVVDGEAAATSLRAGLDLPDVVVRVADEPPWVSPELGAALGSSDIPLVAVAPPLDADARRQLLSTGAVEVLELPVDPARLAERVMVYARLRRSQRRALGAQAARMDSLRLAQEAVLPRPADLPAARFAVTYFPVCEAGGDYYDVFPMDAGGFGYLVADVSGHDLGASYVTSALKALAAAAVRGEASLERVMDRLNAGLGPLLSGGRYLTACLAHLDRAQGRLRVACAGHPAPILVPTGGPPRCVGGWGDVLGAFARVEVPVVEVAVAPGDRVLLYSDGLSCLAGGEDPVAALLAQADRTRDLPLDLGVSEAVIQLLAGAGQPDDDLVLLGVDV